MHELSIAENIIEIIKSKIKDREIKTIKKIVIENGLLSGINKHALKFAFDSIKKDYNFIKNSKIIIEDIKFQIFCLECKKNFIFKKPITKCKICKSYNIKIKEDNYDLVIKEIIINDK